MSAVFGGGRFVVPGNQYLIDVPVPASLQISVGDFLYWDAGNSVAKPFSGKSLLATQALDQADVANLFLGVATQARLAAQAVAGVITCAQEVIYQADVASGTFELGQLVGAVRDGGGTYLEDQKVATVAAPFAAIGAVVQREASAKTKVQIRLTGKTSPAGNPYRRGIGGLQGTGSTAMSDADTTLTVASNPIQVGVPTAARKVILPNPAYSAGLTFLVVNNSAGAFALNVRDSGDTATIVSVAQNKRALFVCDGATWFGLAGA